MTHPYLITIAKTLTLLLGGLITYLAYRAYARTGAPALRALAIGFAVVALGGIAGGSLHLLRVVDLRTGVLIQSSLTAVGFAVITYSLYAE